MKDKARKPTTTSGSEPAPTEVLDLPERWSVQRKTELILRLPARRGARRGLAREPSAGP